jgi:hypothetical protein
VVPQHHFISRPSPGGPGATPEAFEAEVTKLGLPVTVLKSKVGQAYKISSTGEVK